MAMQSLGSWSSTSSSNPTFSIPTEPLFRPNPVLHPYPASLAFWHNPHLLHQSVPDPSHAAAQTQTTSDAPEPKKHKRTRSGCYTCRSRRIKCDESRPVCERCGKGNRECVYPPPPESRKGSRSNLKSSGRYSSIPESESEDDAQRDKSGGSGPAKHRQQHSGLSSRARNTLSRRRSAQALPKRRAPQCTESTSNTRETSSSPSSNPTPDSLSAGINIDFSTLANESPQHILSDLPGVSNLKPDVQFFLAYRRKYVGSRHYFSNPYKHAFVDDDLMLYAVEYEPLLYAVVGFAAYHYSLAHPNGKVYTFLQYYNQSVSLLLKSLQAGDRHSDSMLLTILQLIAFEEHLGDWVNLIDHHEAAHRMILELYTPEIIREDEFRRNILMWYCRYDVMAGLIGGNATILGREWYTAVESASRQEAADSPGDLSKKCLAWISLNRIFAMDMASTFAKAFNGLIDSEGFAMENRELLSSLEELRQFLDSFKDSENLFTCCPAELREPNGVINAPTSIFTGPLWDLNLCSVDLIGATLMYKFQLSILTQNTDLSELREMSLSQCRTIEAMLQHSESPNELLMCFRNILGFIAVFLDQNDEAQRMWCRRKLATIEQLGYVYPPVFRNKMADVWKIPEVAHWWLPNDEGYPNIVREIREWTNERTGNPRDMSREAVRDLKSIFGRMNLEDSTSASSSPSTLSGPYAERTPD